MEGKGQKWKMSWTQLPTSLCPNSLRLKNAWIWGQLPLGQYNIIPFPPVEVKPGSLPCTTRAVSSQKASARAKPHFVPPIYRMW